MYATEAKCNRLEPKELDNGNFYNKNFLGSLIIAKSANLILQITREPELCLGISNQIRKALVQENISHACMDFTHPNHPTGGDDLRFSGPNVDKSGIYAYRGFKIKVDSRILRYSISI